MSEQSAPAANPATPDTEVPEGYFASITLRKPINREGSSVERLLLRDPNGTALMDCGLYDLMRMDTRQIITLLPRIAEPPITNHEAAALGGKDIYEIGQEISAFLLL